MLKVPFYLAFSSDFESLKNKMRILGLIRCIKNHFGFYWFFEEEIATVTQIRNSWIYWWFFALFYLWIDDFFSFFLTWTRNIEFENLSLPLIGFSKIHNFLYFIFLFLWFPGRLSHRMIIMIGIFGIIILCFLWFVCF